MTREQLVRYGVIAMLVAVPVGIGVAYWRATIQVIGDECPVIDAVPEGTTFADRQRTDQRLDLDYDLRPTRDGPALACLNILGQAKCESDGPAILAGQLGYRGDITYFSIPEGRTAMVRLSSSRLLCVMPDP